MKVGLFSCMKNEGPFILEWVAYNLNLGFDPIVIYSNDCTDGTSELLDALHAQGAIHHVKQNLAPDDVPQYTAAVQAYDHPAFADADWLMWMDADEFLVCSDYDNDIKSLATYIDAIADGVCINWLNFGDAGRPHWEPGLITENYTQRGVEDSSRHVMFKTLFKKSDKVRGFGLHRPFLKAGFRRDGRGMVNTAGIPMHEDIYRSGAHKRHALGNAPATLVAHEAAALFHYAVKSRDCYEMKRTRGQGTKAGNATDRASRFAEKYWNIYNQNAVTDQRILPYVDAIKAKIDDLTQDAATARAHTECNARYAEQLRLHRAKR